MSCPFSTDILDAGTFAFNSRIVHFLYLPSYEVCTMFFVTDTTIYAEFGRRQICKE